MREIYEQNIVVGSGAAGLACALRLAQENKKRTALLTEDMKAGTSRNTGSDKQTYYKLSLAADDLDSIHTMAEDLVAGQCVDGDMALCEAGLSVRAFMNLVELGVPFPCTEYGEYMGYKTDHDHGRRATSAGPYTSRQMTEALEKAVRDKKIPIYNKMQALKLLIYDRRVYGVLCLDLHNRAHPDYVLFWAQNVVLATGGPAGIYHDSVYPQSQIGASGMAFEAGVLGKNLTEWQFGIASIQPRWNVSGTYMQVLPTFYSTKPDRSDEREFLLDYFSTPEEMLSLIFLKGYQWPFDVQKIFSGSSLLDLLVYQETILKGRRVWLDFRVNSQKKEILFNKLSSEAYDYLGKAGALFGTPIERLEHMNAPAVRFYQEHQVDLHRERLEIAVCAQHNNGGLATDANWQTDVEGLYAVGEVNGSHGVTRPGGAALNAGQVGALRAAAAIACKLRHGSQGAVPTTVQQILRAEAEKFVQLPYRTQGKRNLADVWQEVTQRMSACGGMVRDPKKIQRAFVETETLLQNYPEQIHLSTPAQTGLLYRLRDLLVAQTVYLFAMLDYTRQGAGSRGSALYTDPAGRKPRADLPDCYRCVLDEGRHGRMVQEVSWDGKNCRSEWRPVRPIPQLDYFFETQWRAYRERQGFEQE